MIYPKDKIKMKFVPFLLISSFFLSSESIKNDSNIRFQCVSINIYKLEDIFLQSHSKRILLEHKLRNGDTIVFHKEAYMLKGQDTYDTFVNKNRKWFQIIGKHSYIFFDSDSIQLNKATDTINDVKHFQGYTTITYNNCFTYTILDNLGNSNYKIVKNFKLGNHNDTLFFNSNFGFYKEVVHSYDYGNKTTTELIKKISCWKPDSYIKQQADSIAISFNK